MPQSLKKAYYKCKAGASSKTCKGQNATPEIAMTSFTRPKAQVSGLHSFIHTYATNLLGEPG